MAQTFQAAPVSGCLCFMVFCEEPLWLSGMGVVGSVYSSLALPVQVTALLPKPYLPPAPPAPGSLPGRCGQVSPAGVLLRGAYREEGWRAGRMRPHLL